MNNEQRAAMRKLAEEATPIMTDLCGDRYFTPPYSTAELTVEQDRFIEHANPQAILELLDHIETLEKDAARYRWQPIETAPMDGTVFLGYRDGKVREAYRVQRDDCEMWVFGGSSGSIEFAPRLKPTHWMPLPNAATGETK